MAAKRTPKPKPEITHVDLTMADTGTATGADAVASIDASLTVTDTATMTGGVRSPWSYSDFIDDTMPMMLGRDEVLGRLRQRGDEVSERTLRTWESTGVLPRPIRRWQEGGSRSASRTLYPNWAVAVIGIAKAARAEGYDADQTRQALEEVIPEVLAGHDLGVRYGVVGFHLGVAIKGIASMYPWPKDRPPAVLEVRILDAEGAELHTQKISIPSGETITDDTSSVMC